MAADSGDKTPTLPIDVHVDVVDGALKDCNLPQQEALVQDMLQIQTQASRSEMCFLLLVQVGRLFVSHSPAALSSGTVLASRRPTHSKHRCEPLQAASIQQQGFVTSSLHVCSKRSVLTIPTLTSLGQYQEAGSFLPASWASRRGLAWKRRP